MPAGLAHSATPTSRTLLSAPDTSDAFRVAIRPGCRLRCRVARSATLVVLCLAMAEVLSACAIYSPGRVMVSRRRAFEADFLPTLGQYERLSDAMAVYEQTVRRIAQEVGWAMTDLDELGLAAVKAIAVRADRGEMRREEAVYYMRLVDVAVSEIYRRRAMDAVAAWNLYSRQYFDRPALRGPITCFRYGNFLSCN